MQRARLPFFSGHHTPTAPIQHAEKEPLPKITPVRNPKFCGGRHKQTSSPKAKPIVIIEIAKERSSGSPPTSATSPCRTTTARRKDRPSRYRESFTHPRVKQASHSAAWTLYPSRLRSGSRSRRSTSAETGRPVRRGQGGEVCYFRRPG